MPLLDINDNLIENADENSKNKGTKRKKASDQSNLIDTVLIKFPRATENLEIIDTDIKQIVFDFISNNQLIYLNVLNFEPLDFKVFSEQLANELKLLKKIEDKTLMRILDEYGITFTLKSLNSRKKGPAKKKDGKNDANDHLFYLFRHN